MHAPGTQGRRRQKKPHCQIATHKYRVSVCIQSASIAVDNGRHLLLLLLLCLRLYVISALHSQPNRFEKTFFGFWDDHSYGRF